MITIKSAQNKKKMYYGNLFYWASKVDLANKFKLEIEKVRISRKLRYH